jgi:hypothetical protein
LLLRRTLTWAFAIVFAGAVAAADDDVSVTLAVKDARTQFRVGETIPMELRFRANVPGKYRVPTFSDPVKHLLVWRGDCGGGIGGGLGAPTKAKSCTSFDGQARCGATDHLRDRWQTVRGLYARCGPSVPTMPSSITLPCCSSFHSTGRPSFPRLLLRRRRQAPLHPEFVRSCCRKMTTASRRGPIRTRGRLMNGTIATAAGHSKIAKTTDCWSKPRSS